MASFGCLCIFIIFQKISASGVLRRDKLPKIAYIFLLISGSKDLYSVWSKDLPRTFPHFILALILNIRLEGPVLAKPVDYLGLVRWKWSPLWCIYLVRWWAYNGVLIKNDYLLKLLERGGRRRRHSIQNFPQA